MTQTDAQTLLYEEKVIRQAQSTLNALEKGWSEVRSAQSVQEDATRSLDDSASEVKALRQDLAKACESTHAALNMVRGALKAAEQAQASITSKFEREMEGFSEGARGAFREILDAQTQEARGDIQAILEAQAEQSREGIGAMFAEQVKIVLAGFQAMLSAYTERSGEIVKDQLAEERMRTISEHKAILAKQAEGLRQSLDVVLVDAIQRVKAERDEALQELDQSRQQHETLKAKLSELPRRRRRRIEDAL